MDLWSVLLLAIFSAVEPSSGVINPGLVRDGTRCGTDRVCINQECRNISTLNTLSCPIGENGVVCSGNNYGICNNLGECSCLPGQTGPTCNTTIETDLGSPTSTAYVSTSVQETLYTSSTISYNEATPKSLSTSEVINTSEQTRLKTSPTSVYASTYTQTKTNTPSNTIVSEIATTTAASQTTSNTDTLISSTTLTREALFYTHRYFLIGMGVLVLIAILLGLTIVSGIIATVVYVKKKSRQASVAPENLSHQEMFTQEEDQNSLVIFTNTDRLYPNFSISSQENVSIDPSNDLSLTAIQLYAPTTENAYAESNEVILNKL